MSRTRDRLPILMAPHEDGKPTELPEHAGPPTVLTGLPRTIRRHELRLVVPLSDTTIYDMEVRGEFPRRFYLTPRSVVWDLGEVEAWLRQRRAESDAGSVVDPVAYIADLAGSSLEYHGLGLLFVGVSWIRSPKRLASAVLASDQDVPSERAIWMALHCLRPEAAFARRAHVKRQRWNSQANHPI